MSTFKHFSVCLAALLVFTAEHAACRALPGNASNHNAVHRGLSEQPAAAVQPSQSRVGEKVDGQYIVIFRRNTGVASLASQKLAAHVQRGAAAAAASAGAPPLGFEVVNTFSSSLGGSSAAAGRAAAAAGACVTASAAAAQQAAAGGVQGIVVRASGAALAHIRSASDIVQSVVPDRVVVSQQLLQDEQPDVAATGAAAADVAAQQVPGCIQVAAAAIGVSTTLAETRRWPRCLVGNATIVWSGRPCGDGSRIQYTQMRAVDAATGQTLTNGGAPCIARFDMHRMTWSRQRFGTCGIAPLHVPSLPTVICSATGGNPRAFDYASSPPPPPAAPSPAAPEQPASPPLSTTPGGRQTNLNGSSTATPTRVQPTNAPSPSPGAAVASPSPAAAGVSPSLDAPVASPSPETSVASPSPDAAVASPSPDAAVVSPSPYAAVASPSPDAVVASPSPDAAVASPPPDVVVASPSPDAAVVRPPPDAAVASPPPAPSASSGSLLPRVPVAIRDAVPSGVKRIEAATQGGVSSIEGLPAEQQVVVGVVDSGIDATHPDINYAGGQSFLEDDINADRDGYGHGTHVAGIIGAKNNGRGVVGVSPGAPVYSLKVLDSSGRGSISSVLAAVSWVASEGVKQRIRVINLSLATWVDPTDEEEYAATVEAVCGVFADAEAAGVFVTTAAGNYGAALRGYLPASCPSVAAVTAVDEAGTAAAGFSNFLAETGATTEEQARVIAAPGTKIFSTISYAKDASGYRELSGTSMAAPHVAGVAANCMMSGACAQGTSGLTTLATLQAAARERLAANAQYGFTGDATCSVNGKYFGLLSWAKW